MPNKAHPDLEARLIALGSDRTTGAVGLALEAIDLALCWIGQRRSIGQLSVQLEKMHPAIATTRNVGRLLRNHPRQQLPRRLAALRESLLQGNALMAAALARMVPPQASILTLSNSSTVAHALPVLKPAHVYVLESLPGGEGRELTAGLKGQLGGAAVRLVPDAEMGNLVPYMDCALAGVDSYDATGAILHKAGTLPLALCCHYFRKPLYAAGHSLKQVEGLLEPPPSGPDACAEALFDLTPGELITRLITETAA